MKALLILISLSFLQLSFASPAYGAEKKALGYEKSDWDIYEDRYGKYLGLKKVQMKMIKMYTLSGEVALLNVEHPEEAPYLSIIHYYAGAAGTSQIIRSYRAVVYNTKTQRFLGHAAVKHESNGEEQVATWTYHKDKIVIDDPQEGKSTLKIE